jgi:hypothetical protein
MWITLIYPQTSPYGQNFHDLLEEKIPDVRFCLPVIKNHQSNFTDLQHPATVDSYSLKPTKPSLFDNLMVVNHSATFEAYTRLRPFEFPCHLCSFGSSRGTPLCHFSFQLRHVSHFISETAVAYHWSPCLHLDPVPFALRDYSQLEETPSRASFLMTSSQVVPDPLSGKTRSQVYF